MNFEQPPVGPSKNEKEQKEGLGRKIKEVLGALSAVAVLGSAQEGVAGQNQDTMPVNQVSKTENIRSAEQGKVIFSDNSYEVRKIGEKKKTNYGTQQKPRFIEQVLYSVLKKDTREKKYFYADNDTLAIQYAPEWFLTEDDERVIEQERAFQQSGLTDPSDAYKGPISVDGGESNQFLQVESVGGGHDQISDDEELSPAAKEVLKKVRRNEQELKDRGYIQ
jgi:hypothetical protein